VTVLLNDPCDNFTAAPWTVVGSPTISASGHTGNAFQFPAGAGSNLVYSIASGLQTDTITIGFWIRFNGANVQPGAANSHVVLSSDAGATDHVGLRFSDGFVLVYNQSNINLISQALSLTINTWYYFEFQVKLSDTVGSVIVRQNNTVVASISNADTKNGGTKTVWDTVKFTSMGTYGPWLVDDIYIRNDSSYGSTDPTVGSFEAFALRRTTGGDVARATPTSGGAGLLRYGPAPVAWDAVKGTTLTGISWGYDAALLTAQIPAVVPSRGEAVLVRGAFGYPTTPLDGMAIWHSPDNGLGTLVTQQINHQVLDQPVTGGRWYYYTLFVKVVSPSSPSLPGTWQIGATITVLVPKFYGHAEKLFAMIPPFYQRTDDEQVADGRNGPLRKFCRIIGYDLDYNRTLLDGVLNVYDPDFAPLMFTQQVGLNLGLPPEDALGGSRYRSLVGQLWDLEGARGTTPGLQSFIYAASNYQTAVLNGINNLLTADDAEFVVGVGHWRNYANAHYVDMTDTARSNAHPPAGIDFSRVILRLYTAPDLVPAALHGRGVLEIIELTTFAFPGQPGFFTGPQAPFATLAALQGATPPVVMGTVANYYVTTTNPWWSGDYVTLGDGSQAYWTGTAWAAGAAPNTGGSVRPTLTALHVGAPGYTVPNGAAVPANLAAMPSGSSYMIPPVEWKQGDYVVLGDGSQAHPFWHTVGGHPAIDWTSGPGVLTLQATKGQLGFVVGYLPTWQLNDGSYGVAPPTLARLQSLPVIPGRADSSDTYRPWQPSSGLVATENLRTYDNTKVAWLGWKRANSSGVQQVGVQKGGPVTMDITPSVSTTSTAWADNGARAASAMTSSFLCIPTGLTGTTPAVPGWTKLSFPVAGITMTGWTNPSGDHATFRPTVDADARVHAHIQLASGGGNFPVGTAIALFLNGTELARNTADGNYSFLSIHVDRTVTAGTDLDVRVWNPGSTNLDLVISNTSYNWTPMLRADPRPAYLANQTWVAPSAANGTTRHFVISMAPNSSCPTDFYLMKNGLPVAWGIMVNDINTATYLEADVAIATGDVFWIGIGLWYAPYSAYMSVLPGKAPTMYNTRWETVP
jgi:hypothetical protein